MMNRKTRRLSKMLDEVRAEISPWFIEKQTIMEDTPEKIKKLDDTAKHATSSLKVNYSTLYKYGIYITFIKDYRLFYEILMYLGYAARSKYMLILLFFNL